MRRYTNWLIGALTIATTLAHYLPSYAQNQESMLQLPSHAPVPCVLASRLSTASVLEVEHASGGVADWADARNQHQ
ncbi:MAG: hypothetical protein KatS3mg020_1207 [Fimbriimonadales bacterium]|nr:MAG: hypothetical protein KatS3mg020_1207 [Fimbriimonadales bacterium]